ncbi:MAG TPA: biotin--[acetyl-CoA-carboxylase] ligase [Candidatus Dormibacteraeota bacterium]|nr:biotin--[acetyl-CoA-carboxylase] ligase [Candidatus Dormibacteraeota bacterium]
MSRPPGGDPADLTSWLRTRWLGRSSAYHEVIASTQDEARRLAAEGAPHGFLVWAGAQTAGRGRMARAWQSPAAAGLWFSVVLRPSQHAERIAPLPLVTGAAVGTALDALAPGRIRLKWPNDVLLDGAKVAGILVEGHAVEGVIQHAVVGVGVNLARPAGGFSAEIRDLAAAMADATGEPPGAARTLSAILARLEHGYDELLAAGPSPARARWLGLTDTIGRDVVAHVGGREVHGKAVDLDPGGNLVLLVEGRRLTVSHGEIEHLR